MNFTHKWVKSNLATYHSSILKECVDYSWKSPACLLGFQNRFQHKNGSKKTFRVSSSLFVHPPAGLSIPSIGLSQTSIRQQRRISRRTQEELLEGSEVKRSSEAVRRKEVLAFGFFVFLWCKNQNMFGKKHHVLYCRVSFLYQLGVYEVMLFVCCRILFGNVVCFCCLGTLVVCLLARSHVLFFPKTSDGLVSN